MSNVSSKLIWVIENCLNSFIGKISTYNSVRRNWQKCV